MDWFTLLLVFIFFVLPLIQQIAEARKRSGNAPEPELPEEEWEIEEVRRAPLPSGRAPAGEGAPAAGGTNWSEGWGSWPGEVVVLEPAEEEAPRERAPVRVERETPAPVERPAPVRPVEREIPVRAERPPPEPRPERVRVERPVPVEAVSVERRGEPRRPRERSRFPGTKARTRSPLAAALHDGNAVRRAIVLSEVLGPPRALRPLEAERD